jgi:rRNA-processing protein FCF1
MSEPNKKKDNDIFIADFIYPEANSIFKISLKKLKDIKDDCYIVLDTNVLLVPYTTSKESLAQIQKTYETLISESRLIVPVQVAREFAKNRANKLIDLYQDLCRKRDENIQLKKGRYPLLEFLDEYQEVIRLEDEIEKQLREYRKAIVKVLDHIKGWTWDDPVSLLYAELFNESVVLSPHIDKKEITEDLNRRQQHNIPPGYEDSSKPDRGVGDLLIWHTILEVGKTHKKSVIFVSGEKKSDLEIKVQEIENTGSIICPNGTGYLPNFQGRLNPIRDTLERLYLYADNIAIDGGQQQPVYFTLGKPL